jgi:hypothetical protein
MCSMQIRCADCSCLPSKCKASRSARESPNCRWKECCAGGLVWQSPENKLKLMQHFPRIEEMDRVGFEPTNSTSLLYSSPVRCRWKHQPFSAHSRRNCDCCIVVKVGYTLYSWLYRSASAGLLEMKRCCCCWTFFFSSLFLQSCKNCVMTDNHKL